ncbi:MAG: hypothetical protein BWX68_02929 [Verrucomicrobia bacterium ADurb.Bin063]|nr:MAG: hypothetical protein BWX68_02929 [Verrucomicrobia bacterium ADurb.Bin063]
MMRKNRRGTTPAPSARLQTAEAVTAVAVTSAPSVHTASVRLFLYCTR